MRLSVGAAKGQLVRTAGLANDAKGDVCDVDDVLHRPQEFDPRRRHIRTSGDGAIFLSGPTSIAIDPYGNFYAADGRGIVKLLPRRRFIERRR